MLKPAFSEKFLSPVQNRPKILFLDFRRKRGQNIKSLLESTSLGAELTMGHILLPVTHVTHQSADPWPTWPVTQSQTIAWVDHDYSRIMMSS